MTGFYPYLIKSVFALTILYIFYWSLLRKETFFRFNRAYFLLTILIMCILPAVNLGFAKLSQNGSPARVINSGYQYIQNAILLNPSKDQITSSGGLSFKDLILMVYWTGVLLLTIRMIYQTGLVIFLISKSKIRQIDGLKIVPNGRFSVPFAFFSYVFLPQNMLNESNVTTIIIHEKEHIKQAHWIDLLLLEIVSVLQWFNPFVWFFRWSVKETHEFLADQGAIRHGVSKPTYLGLLMEYVLGTPGIGLTHSFNYSLSKKRIQMMKKEKSPNRRKLRIFILFPVILFLSMAFSTTVQDVGSNLFPNIEVQDLGIKINGKIIAKDTGNPLVGAHIIIKGTTNGTTSDEHGKFQIEVSDKRDVLMISYVGYETAAILVEKGNYDEIKMERTSYEIEIDEDYDVDVDVTIDIEDIEDIEVDLKDVEVDISEVEVDVESIALEVVEEVEPVAEIFFVVEDLPSFQGDKTALAKYISTHIKYPEDALKAGKSGTVLVTMRINTKGEIESAKIKKALFPSLDKEALRVVKGMPNWNPGTQDGKPVSCDIDLPIEFKMK
jgi:TonB family protein